jgi:APA family basic amino acid/polyamine antiporter
VSTVSADPGRAAPVRSQLFRLKPVDAIVAQHQETGGSGLRRSMGLLQLTALSIGATLGTGIFVILGEAVPLAGPAVVLGFVLAAVTALFSALSYAELPAASRSRGRRTPTPTPPWASSSPGSAAGA